MPALARGHVEEALDSARTMLEADGYRLDVEVAEGRVRLRIVATPEACEECLVPRTVMEPMIAQMLEDGGVDAALDLAYPDTHHES